MGDTASYAPRSPDLSGASYAPRSPDLSGASYAPQRSPNLAGYNVHGAADIPLQPLVNAQTSSPYLNVPPIQTAFHPESPIHAGAKRTRKSFADDPTYEPSPKTPGRGRKPKKMKVEEEEAEDFGKPAPGVAEGIEVKTKFPVAKIKRIMQHDDEVGKVAQVTPTAVSKALELFMISIVTKAANVAREKNSKKVTVSHMKQVVKEVSEFDFLTDVCDKYTDTSNKKGRGKKEPEESD